MKQRNEMKKSTPTPLKISVAIDEKTLAFLLIGTLTGARYWCEFVGRTKASKPVRNITGHPEFDAIMSGAAFRLRDHLSDEGPKDYTLNFASMKKGLEVMSRVAPAQFGRFLADAADDTTADAFLQCCLFSEVIYG